MVRRVVWDCDNDEHDENNVPSARHMKQQVEGGPLEPLYLDLCDCVYDMTVRELGHLLRTKGLREGGGRPRQVATNTPLSIKNLPPLGLCLLCDAPVQASGLLNHYHARHKCSKEVTSPCLDVTECPICGQGTSGVQANGIHVSRTHSDVIEAPIGLAKALRYALDNGDPYGVARKAVEFLRSTIAPNSHPGSPALGMRK